MARCEIHNDVEVPRETLEIHHKHPQAYGGGDEADNLGLLCTGCHTIIHKAALKLYSGNGGSAKDLMERFLPGQPARQEKLWRLVQIIARARMEHARSTDIPEAGVDDADHQSTVKMSLDMPDWLHHRLKTLSTGQGLGLYVMKVLENHALVATQKPGAPAHELFGAGRDQDQPPAQDPKPTPLFLLNPSTK